MVIKGDEINASVNRILDSGIMNYFFVIKQIHTPAPCNILSDALCQYKKLKTYLARIYKSLDVPFPFSF